MGSMIMTPEVEFQELDSVVRKNAEAAAQFYRAFKEIHDRKLYLEGGFKSWKEYCRSRSVSESHSFRIIAARKVQERLEQSTLSERVVPTSLRKLTEIGKAKPEMQPVVAKLASSRAADEGREPSLDDYKAAIVEAVTEPLNPAGQIKQVVMAKDADQPEEYFDDGGYPVPEDLWVVWRDIPQFHLIADGLRSSGCLELAHKLAALGRKHNSPSVISTAFQIEKMHAEMVRLALSAMPSRVNDLDWMTKREAACE